MKLKVKEQIKILLSQEGIKQKDHAAILSQKTGHFYSATNLSQKLGRGLLTYNEFVEIADILGYEIKLEKLV
ncbi:LLM class flavin-dependent oxidoreductase [bacterium]|nr:LLM class flavin-dependent oxidoreductase [bacterium]